MHARFKRNLAAVIGSGAITALAAGGLLWSSSSARSAAAPDGKAVISHYVDMAAAMYADAAQGARALDKAIDELVAKPSAEALKAARESWKASRPVYQKTEGFRFGNEIVDEWEGKVNAWPLDEGLIDYTAGAYGDSSDENALYAANVIANAKLDLAGKTLDTTTITPEVIREMHEALEVDSNVSSGYHAIEFLLWGQDLNGTGPGAGNRPHTDFDTKSCTGGHCDRRAAYLKAASALLVSDMDEMAKSWAAGGAAREAALAKNETEGLASILTGLGSLSYGELGGERMKLGLMLHDPEEEHDCFSDNTHNSHYFDQVGMMSIWKGEVERADGSVMKGVGLRDLAAARSKSAADALDQRMAASEAALKAIKDRADSGKEAYDQMIGEGNAEGNALVQAGVDALVAQTRAIEKVVADLGLDIKLEGSDSLDDPVKVGTP